MSDELHEAFRSLARLAIELALAMPRENIDNRVVEALNDVIGWRALLAQDGVTRRLGLGAGASSGEAARAAVEATKRRYDRMRNNDPIEADDSRVTDGHKCCGGKPDCGCAGS